MTRLNLDEEKSFFRLHKEQIDKRKGSSIAKMFDESLISDADCSNKQLYSSTMKSCKSIFNSNSNYENPEFYSESLYELFKRLIAFNPNNSGYWGYAGICLSSINNHYLNQPDYIPTCLLSVELLDTALKIKKEHTWLAEKVLVLYGVTLIDTRYAKETINAINKTIWNSSSKSEILKLGILKGKIKEIL